MSARTKIFVVDDDREWLGYYERLLGDEYELEFFRDGVSMIDRTLLVVPDLMILDVLLTGPTGFSILEEMQSYEDLARVPVLLVSGVKIKDDLKEYGVVRVLDKDEMTPRELLAAVRKYGKKS